MNVLGCKEIEGRNVLCYSFFVSGCFVDDIALLFIREVGR